MPLSLTITARLVGILKYTVDHLFRSTPIRSIQYFVRDRVLISLESMKMLFVRYIICQDNSLPEKYCPIQKNLYSYREGAMW